MQKPTALSLPRWRRATAALLATLTAFAASVMAVSAAAPAQAQAGNIVTFGDSYTASPDQFVNHMWNSSLSSADPNSEPHVEQRGGCLQATSNWPRQMQAQTGVPVVDWSCTAETSQRVIFRVNEAIRFGDIHPGTRAVYFSVGANNYGPFGINEGRSPLDQGSMIEGFSNDMAQAAAAVRSVAPNAQLVVAGMPQVTNGSGLCLLNVIPGVPMGVPVPGVLAENSIREMQRIGAERNGMTFVDNYALTRGHGTCSTNDSQRYVAGMIDFTSPAYDMSLHPTHLGHSVLARNNAAAIGL